jgi:hypothetical protein
MPMRLYQKGGVMGGDGALRARGTADLELVDRDANHPQPGSGLRLVGFAMLPRLLTWLAVAALLSIGAVLALAHPRYLVNTLVLDDAGYYMAIARNHSLGLGWTFDRVSETNGYNPLLAFMLTALNQVFAANLDLVTCFRIAALTTWVFLAVGLIPFRLFTRRVLVVFNFPAQWQELAVSVATLFYVGAIASKGLYGSDAFLVLSLALLWLERISRKGLLSPRLVDGLVDGALLGLIVLARLDSLAFAISAFGLMFLRVIGHQGRLSALLLRAAIFIGVVGPYFFYNKINFGDFLPVSARLKSNFPHLDVAESLQVFFANLSRHDAALLVAVWIMAAFWVVDALRQLLVFRMTRGRTNESGESTGVSDAMMILAFSLLGRVTLLLLFSRLDVQSVYAILAWPFFVIAALVLFGRWRPPIGASVMCIGLAAVSMALFAGKTAKIAPEMESVATGRGESGWDLGRRIHDSTKPEDVIFGGSQGLLGYISDRAWINGDGVANNAAYQEAIRDGELNRYLQCSEVDYVVAELRDLQDPPGEFSYEARSFLYGAREELAIEGQNKVLSGVMVGRSKMRVWLGTWEGEVAGGDDCPLPDGK